MSSPTSNSSRTHKPHPSGFRALMGAVFDRHHKYNSTLRKNERITQRNNIASNEESEVRSNSSDKLKKCDNDSSDKMKHGETNPSDTTKKCDTEEPMDIDIEQENVSMSKSSSASSKEKHEQAQVKPVKETGRSLLHRGFSLRMPSNRQITTDKLRASSRLPKMKQGTEEKLKLELKPKPKAYGKDVQRLEETGKAVRRYAVVAVSKHKSGNELPSSSLRKEGEDISMSSHDSLIADNMKHDVDEASEEAKKVLLTKQTESTTQHHSIPSYIRASIRCTRQTQHTEVFHRGAALLRDSRRRTAEQMNRRRSQPSLLEQGSEEPTQQQVEQVQASSDHKATKVTFSSQSKPTVMNKWIRMSKNKSKSTYASANLAFQKDSNLVKQFDDASSRHEQSLDDVFVTDLMASRDRANSKHSYKHQDDKHRNLHESVEEEMNIGKGLGKTLKFEERVNEDNNTKAAGYSQVLTISKDGNSADMIPFVDSESDLLKPNENVVWKRQIQPAKRSRPLFIRTQQPDDILNKQLFASIHSKTGDNDTGNIYTGNCNTGNISTLPTVDKSKVYPYQYPTQIPTNGISNACGSSTILLPPPAKKRSTAIWRFPVIKDKHLLNQHKSADVRSSGEQTADVVTTGDRQSLDTRRQTTKVPICMNESNQSFGAGLAEEGCGGFALRKHGCRNTLSSGPTALRSRSVLSWTRGRSIERTRHPPEVRRYCATTQIINELDPMTIEEPNNAVVECSPMGSGEEPVNATAPSSDRSSCDVERILHNTIYRRPFQQFLEQQFCAENINFYVAVEEYRAIPDGQMERRVRVAKQIYERHFTPNSVEPVNIDNSTSKSIRDAVSSQRFSAQLYDVAQYQIFHLLKYDCWPRYLRAGGVAPTFDDSCNEQNPGPSSQSPSYPCGPQQAPRGIAAMEGGQTAASSTGSGSPNRNRQSSTLTSAVCTRFCTLMHNEIATSEQIPLSDPTESVGKWTSMMAAKRGMDPRASEAVDAQSLSTIDPARQAMDALNNRCVCLMPVLHFAMELVAPSAASKAGSPPTTRIVLLRARHGLSSGVVLRSVLSKFSVDYDTCVTVISTTIDVIAAHTSVGTIGSRCVTVMSQQQYQERQHSPKRELVKEVPISAHFLSPDANVPFYQHGDVAFFELPADVDPRTGKTNAARSLSNAKTDHTSGLLKFVRKASQAVTSREPTEQQQQPTPMATSSHPTHHLPAHHPPSASISTAYTDKIRRKSVGTFQRTSSTAAASDIPYCGENNVLEESREHPDKRMDMSSIPVPTVPVAIAPVQSGGGGQPAFDGRGTLYELPDFLRKDNIMESSTEESIMKVRSCGAVSGNGTNGTTARIPPIYASAVPSDKDLTPCDVEKAIVWQSADYV